MCWYTVQERFLTSSSSWSLELQREGVGLGGKRKADLVLPHSGLGSGGDKAAVTGGVEGWACALAGQVLDLGQRCQLHPLQELQTADIHRGFLVLSDDEQLRWGGDRVSKRNH